jgi:hypothetical protein
MLGSKFRFISLSVLSPKIKKRLPQLKRGKDAVVLNHKILHAFVRSLYLKSYKMFIS